ncbi:hypothetical protein V1512DRAFT_256785 [Lipomyces arxii]|uniref:uncharacterized protein n=1 Tax=Lipomyces arxii TaxID=56418 RepID=UPI0034CDA202
MDTETPSGENLTPTSPSVDAMFDEFTQQGDDAMTDDYATLSPGSSNGDLGSATTPTGSTTLSSAQSPPSTNSLSYSTDSGTGSTSTPSMSRRGSTRKSTLTQQQKNNKRQRATTEQLTILENEFSVNAAPNGKTRQRIANSINMTERSVQIWFQNRRAKIKLLAKKSIETGEDSDLIPKSMKEYLAVQAAGTGFTTSNAYFARGFGLTASRATLGRSASFSNVSDRPFMMPGIGDMPFSAVDFARQAQAQTAVSRINCRSLMIGTWRRVSSSAMDFVVLYTPSQQRFTYFISNDSIGFKIEYFFASVQKIYVEGHRSEGGSKSDSNSSTGLEMGDLVIVLSHPPQFYMETSGPTVGWFETGDFTENQQATMVLEHRLSGPLKALEQQLAELLCLKPDGSLPNRPMRSNSSESSASTGNSVAGRPMVNASSFTSSAPVSPLVASTMSGMPPPVAMMSSAGVGFADDAFSFPSSQRGKPVHLSHKRTRSRSVPAAIDFSYLGTGITPESFAFSPGVQQHFVPPMGPVLLGVPPVVLSAVPTPTLMDMSSAPVHDAGLQVDPTAAAQYMDISYFPQMHMASDTPTLASYSSPTVLNTSIMPMPTGVDPVAGAGDIVGGSPYGMTNMWVDNAHVFSNEQITPGYDMGMQEMFTNDASVTSMSEDVVMPDKAESFGGQYVKPEDSMQGAPSNTEAQTDELLEFQMMGLNTGPPS